MDVIRILQLLLALVVGIFLGYYGLRELPEFLQNLALTLGFGALAVMIFALWRWDNRA